MILLLFVADIFFYRLCVMEGSMSFDTKLRSFYYYAKRLDTKKEIT